MNISQRIPNLLAGISQQPDNRKRPGQVKDAKNVFPDYALGMLKRPGGRFLSQFYGAGASTDNKWFTILRDGDEKYAVQYADNSFQIWSLIDGMPRAVDMGDDTGVPGTCNVATLTTESNDVRTALTTLATETEDLRVVAGDLKRIQDGQHETVDRLFEITNTYDNAEIISSVKSGITLDADGRYTLTKDGTVEQSLVTSITGDFSVGSERTDEYPLIASQGLRLFEAYEEVAAVNNAADLTAAEDDYEDGGSGALPDFNTAQTAFDTALTTDWEAAHADCVITTVPADAYLNGATADQIKTLTVNDTTYIINTAKEVEMLTDAADQSPDDEPRACAVVNVASFSTQFRVRVRQGTGAWIEGVVDIDETVTGNVLSPGYIATEIASDFNGNAGANTINATAINNVVVFEREGTNTNTNSFQIEARGGLAKDAIIAFSETITSTVDLPESCINDYLLKVANSSDLAIDDMYVQFEADNGTSGYGIWVETVAPNINISFDPLTMPHQLTRQADGSFVYGPVSWDDRVIGDDTTNPEPSFVGKRISGLVFHRNRLGLMAEDNLVFSRAGDIQNFWATSALAGLASDPIDISTSGNQPVVLTHGIATSIGLVLYSKSAQFLLTTDSDTFSSSTTNIKTLSTYDADDTITPVSLGTTQAFISKTPLFSKFFELIDINIDQPPVMNDTTVSVPELLPESIDTLAASADLSLVAASTKGERDIYLFRFLSEDRNSRTIQTWFRWKVTGDVLHHFFDGNSFYAITTNGDEVALQKFDISQSNEQGFLQLPTGEKTDVCLDMYYVNPHRTYNATDDETTITLPYDHVADNGKFTVIALGGYLGDAVTAASAETVGKILTPTVTHTDAEFGDTCVIDGDYRGLNLIIGYQFDMSIDLPKLFFFSSDGQATRYDDNANLIIHRLKVSTGLSGPVVYQLNITGRDQFDETIEVAQPYAYSLNSVNMQSSATHEVPIYQRNENLTLSITSTGPFPVSLLGYDYEGRYNNKFYRRK